MNRFAFIALCLSASTGAVADGRGADGVSLASDAGSTMFPLRPPTIDADESAGAETVQVNLMGRGKGFRGATEYDFDVSGEAYTVSVNHTSRQSTLALYNADSDLVVGYVASNRGATIFDDGGIVERGTPNEVNMATLQDYGAAATLLTNPVFLDSFLEANDEDFWGGDDPPAIWWVGVAYIIVRCVHVSGSYDSEGNWSVEGGIDC